VLIELMRKAVATDARIDNCAICGNDFNLGSVHAMASTDEGYVIGPMCPTCLGYLNERKEKGDERASSNWPGRGWPTTDVLEEARRRYPEPMFDTADDLLAAAKDPAEDERICKASVVWAMKRESAIVE
jgi:hypothetical protein